jgi:class 3 adenylate cyclase
MARLTPKQRRELPDSAFAYIGSDGKRRLPINDEAHVKNALARFERVKFESPEAKEKARKRLLNAAKKHGIVPVGFITTQLEVERLQGQIEGRQADLASLPSGLLTLLFTDIEGSTRLLHELGDSYVGILETARDVIGAAIAAHGGHEVEMRADETFSVYESAPDAVRAAVAMQRELAARQWPDGAAVRIRIGLHTGRTEMTDTGYVGLAVNTASRVCDAGHGGQILASAATFEACAGEFAFRSLGSHALAGLAPTEILQVEGQGLDEDFPDLRR